MVRVRGIEVCEIAKGRCMESLTGVGEIPNRGLVRLVPFFLLTSAAMLAGVFPTVVYQGITPGGVRFGGPGFVPLFLSVAAVVVPLATLFMASFQVPRAPLCLRMESAGFSFASVRWVKHLPRRVRVEVPLAGVIEVRPWGLGLFYMVMQSRVVEPIHGRGPLGRDGVYVDQSVLDQFGLKPRTYRFVYLN
jgi:hypothetical protein